MRDLLHPDFLAFIPVAQQKFEADHNATDTIQASSDRISAYEAP